MTKKKTKQEPKAEPKRKRPAALSEERTHRLRKDQLLKYRVLEAETRAAIAEQAQAQQTLDLLISGQPEIQRAINVLAERASEAKSRLDEYRAYMARLGELLGLNMADVAIDDETGLVREIPKSEPTS